MSAHKSVAQSRALRNKERPGIHSMLPAHCQHAACTRSPLAASCAASSRCLSVGLPGDSSTWRQPSTIMYRCESTAAAALPLLAKPAPSNSTQPSRPAAALRSGGCGQARAVVREGMNWGVACSACEGAGSRCRRCYKKAEVTFLVWMVSARLVKGRKWAGLFPGQWAAKGPKTNNLGAPIQVRHFTDPLPPPTKACAAAGNQHSPGAGESCCQSPRRRTAPTARLPPCSARSMRCRVPCQYKVHLTQAWERVITTSIKLNSRRRYSAACNATAT